MSQTAIFYPPELAEVNVGKVEVIARAICFAAGIENTKTHCPHCKVGKCQLWKSFREEARAATKSYDEYREKTEAESKAALQAREESRFGRLFGD